MHFTLIHLHEKKMLFNLVEMFFGDFFLTSKEKIIYVNNVYFYDMYEHTVL